MLTVETDKAIYDLEFGYVQLEITGRCNMHCMHCRASNMTKANMELDEISKLSTFAVGHGTKTMEMVISGGEPTLHPNFAEVLLRIKNSGVENASITTNGLCFGDSHLEAIRNANFNRLMVSVSLDSADPAKHIAMRQHPRAFSGANEALDKIINAGIPGTVASIRSTIKPGQIGEMESIVIHGASFGVKRFGFSSVLPSGRAYKDKSLEMTPKEKRLFLEKIQYLQNKYSSIAIDTNDPLKHLVYGNEAEKNKDENIVFGGCGAGAITFNVNSDGIMTPCAMLDVVIMDTRDKNIVEIEEAYRQSRFVQRMLDLRLSKKCGKCSHKYQCVGCRARALSHAGDCFGDDPHCWI